MKFVLEEANLDQVIEIWDLINLAYRGESGWTKGTEIVGGNRSEIEEVREYIENPESHLLVASDGGSVKTCICVEENDDCGYIGYFAVHPSLQGTGVGK